MDPVEALRAQAAACRRLGSPMYAALLPRLADDYAAGGPTAAVLGGHEDDTGPSGLALRLLGSVHRLVLTGRAPSLQPYYPSTGGRFVEDGAVSAMLELFADDAGAVREWLDRAPQTNEVGRSAALFGGLLHLPWHLPVRLFEIGASGGLNLLADRFAYETSAGVLGAPDSPVRLSPAWDAGPKPRTVEIVHRAGSDISPVDVTTDGGRLRLAAYVWPDQVERFARLNAAMDMATQAPCDVSAVDAVTFVRGLDLEQNAVTVLWHSVMFQYLTPDDRVAVNERIAELGEAAGPASPFAHLFLEPTRRTPETRHEFLVVLQTWPRGGQRVLGTAHPHGLPVTWE